MKPLAALWDGAVFYCHLENATGKKHLLEDLISFENLKRMAKADFSAADNYGGTRRRWSLPCSSFVLTRELNDEKLPLLR
jgi:hypothetical protein